MTKPVMRGNLDAPNFRPAILMGSHAQVMSCLGYGPRRCELPVA
jgi:hypothetical protein